MQKERINKIMIKEKIENVVLNMVLSSDEIVVGRIIQRKTIHQSDIDELAVSIKQSGLTNPITVMRKGDHYELIAGLSRFTACKQIKLKKIPCRVFNVSPEEAIKIGIEENVLRKPVNPFDEGEYFKEVLVDMKISQKGLARMIGRSESYVSERIKLTTCLAAAADAVKSGILTMNLALEISRCKDTNEALNILATVLENGASEKLIKYWVEQANMKVGRVEEPLEENEELPEVMTKYEAPITFCDLCENKTEFLNSKFIRICPECFNVAKANLKQ